MGKEIKKMPEKRKQAVRRKLSGLLAITMLFGAMFNHFWGGAFYATSPDVASASDAIRDGRVSLTNLPAEDVQVIVMSDEGGYEAGGQYCLDVYIKNNTGVEITDGGLSYRAAGIEKESVAFEDLSEGIDEKKPITIVTDSEDKGIKTDEAGTAGLEDRAEGTGLTDGTADTAAEEAKEADGAAAGADMDVDKVVPAGGVNDDEDTDQADDDRLDDDGKEEDPSKLTELTIQPGQGYHVQFYFQIKDTIKGTRSQKIEFIFRWKDENGKSRSASNGFYYVVGAMNLLPVEIRNPYLTEDGQTEKLYAGGRGEMLIDFELGGVWEIIEEIEQKADETRAPEERPASPSDASVIEEEEPGAQGPAGQEPGAQGPAGEEPGIQDPAGQEPEVQDPAGQEPGIEDLAGEEPGVQDPAGQEPEEQDPSGRQPVEIPGQVTGGYDNGASNGAADTETGRSEGDGPAAEALEQVQAAGLITIISDDEPRVPIAADTSNEGLIETEAVGEEGAKETSGQAQTETTAVGENGPQDEVTESGSQPSPNEPEGQPSQSEPEDQPSQSEPEGQPSPNEPESQPSQSEPEGQPSPNEPEGQPSQSVPMESAAQPSQAETESLPPTNAPSKFPQIGSPSQAGEKDSLDDYENGAVQWGEENDGNGVVEKVKCDVETYGIRLTDFRLAPREEEDEYGTTARCTFRVGKDVKPGTYYGTITANYRFKNKKFTSSQGFAIQVAMIDDEAVAAVVALIDELPEMEEIEENLRAFEMAEDDEGYEAYYMALTDQVMTAYYMYQDLTEEQQEMVYNRDKLMGFEWLWSVMTLAYIGDDDPNVIIATAVNVFSWGSRAFIVSRSNGSGTTVKSIISDVPNLAGWYTAEINLQGNSFIVGNIGRVSNTIANTLVPQNGFLLVWYKGSGSGDEGIGEKNINVGDVIDVSGNWQTTQSFNSRGVCTLTLSDPGVEKVQNDNTDKLHIVQGADTNDFITVNLYDYYDGEYNYNKDGNVGKSAINEPYKDKKYPGFQWPGGTKLDFTKTTSSTSSNFGDIIVADEATGVRSVTNQGGAINQTTKTDTANLPINHFTMGASPMSPKLTEDGYPALSDGTSLAYLFSDSDYASKKNSGSINGLFQYNEKTGAYTFNSRENHAQYNDDDTFTLYKEIITSNFIMYPFGNFLPFNDIVHECTQTSSIVADKDAGKNGEDRISGSAYFEKLAASARYKYNSNRDAQEYTRLAAVLRKWAGLMDAQYPEGWGAEKAMEQYFSNVPPAKEMPYNNKNLMEKLYSIDYDEPTDFFFGMDMSMEFMQPKGGLTGLDGQQLTEFYFTGDDDVWVYVDGNLFLDLSGIHRHVGGKIDFVNGLVSYYKLSPETGDVVKDANYTETFAQILRRIDGLDEAGLKEILKQDENGNFTTFKDYSLHKFNFYYMERGSGSGVCRMNFNFPLLRDNTLSVTKQLTALDEQGDETDVKLLGNPDFHFQVLKANGTGEKDELYIEEGTPYKIYDGNKNLVGDGITGANGVFTIKAGQTAVFEVEENRGSYYVRELMDKEFLDQYKDVVVDGTSIEKNLEDEVIGERVFVGFESDIKDISNASSTVFNFTNRVTLNRMGALEIAKELERLSADDSLQAGDPTGSDGGTQAEADGKRFAFMVKLDDTPLPVGTEYRVEPAADPGSETGTRKVEKEGIVELAAGEKAVIDKILAGSRFTVEEVEASAAGYDVIYKLDEEVVGTGIPTGVIKPKDDKDQGGLVEIAVINKERGTSIEIPVTKTLKKPDGKEHTYRFLLQQVTDKSGTTEIDAAAGGIRQELSVTIPAAGGPVTQSFILRYLEKDLPAQETLPKTYHYKITEIEEADQTDTTLFDKTAYIIQVDVAKAGAEGILEASIIGCWKMGNGEDKVTISQEQGLPFTNTLLGAELPETGGPGTFWYTFSGVAMMAIALMYDTFRRRKRRLARR